MQTRIAALRTQIEQNKVLLPRMEALIRAIDAVKDKVALSSYWLEKLNELPLVKERRASSVRRINEIAHETIGLKAQLLELLHEQEQLSEQTSGYADLQVELAAADRSIEETRHKMADVQSEIGALHERLYRIEKRREEIAEKQDEAVRLGKKAAIYDTLKAAFSQDGIPHNIIRSMLPLLSSTANTILGQMTGGKMGMEFVTDKVLKSNSKKEVPTLDIIINEYGKDSLPYLSKSGGEKVKASLSAILALAEIKSSQAGIQLGMLFIDEPPFLDADGIQAYCDALETIQARYTDLKVMAITHDPTMKARFPQSIDIIKTPEGSRVELG